MNPKRVDHTRVRGHADVFYRYAHGWRVPKDPSERWATFWPDGRPWHLQTDVPRQWDEERPLVLDPLDPELTYWPKSLTGHLQHDLGVQCPVVSELRPHEPNWVWSERAARRSRAARVAVPTGSPWAYLCLMYGIDLADPTTVAGRGHGTLVVPHHGMTGVFTVDAVLGELAARGETEVAVGLHHADLRSPIADRYRSAGHHVVDLGPDGAATDAGVYWPDLTLAAVRTHARVLVSRPGVEQLVAALLGRQVGCLTAGSDPQGAPYWLEPMTSATVPTADAIAVARSELGLEALMSPSEMIELFDWRARD
ncbi:hypothetical protein [Microlunatus sp. Y2014]|uniref:hypothetical protein n=1 Tax=Microlunatus sp. Y2014 TaxID=3418488 RepID=UPI003DA709DF